MTINKNYIAFQTLFNREIKRIFRIWRQTFLPPLITQSLYFAIFGGVIGSQLSSWSGNYTQFLVPGIIFMSAITSAFTSTSFTIFSIKFQKSIEEIITSPTPNWIVILAYTMSAVVRGYITASMILLVSIFFVRPQIDNPLLALFSLTISCVLFAGLGILSALYSKNFDDVSTVPVFILTPLTYLGGVFYDINMLKQPFKSISEYNPIVYMVDLFRTAFKGSGNYNIFLSLTIISFVTIAVFSLVSYLWSKGMGIKN
ncbi:MAG: ABC transporter permease [Patescibacteria group bacterium]